ncbi:MAG: DEAD/DEAH box helicase family protein [Hydrogenophilaceae bacterium]|jgi:type I restriction enzyme R subunit|nr:DEAD/DEAH box helicase family protein [Hydrogenophilaceae bacterium]
MANEAFSRVQVDALLKDVGWSLTDGRSVRFEVPCPDRSKADYVLGDRNGRALAVVEAKRAAISPVEAEGQALAYAKQLGTPFVFLTNGEEVWFWEHAREAHPRQVRTFFSQLDLERRAASYAVRRDLLSVPVDHRIAGREYQSACIEAVSREIAQGRRSALIEMATGTGKTRTAAALIKRLFEAGLASRVLFLVDRKTLAKQTAEAFEEALPEYASYWMRAGRFRDEKQITITTLQSMINIYRDYSSGYFDLVITDECHRSIYGKWSGVLKHFDGFQVGLTATPCVASDETLARLEDEDQAFVRDTLRFFNVEKPTYRYTMKEAIADGYLVPYHVYKAKTVKTAAEDGFPVKRDEIDWSGLDAETKAELEQAFGEDGTLLVDPNALERKFTIPERNRAIVREFRKVLDEGYLGPDGVMRRPQIGKTIVFAVSKRHAETLARMFDDAFADQKPSPETRYADFVVSDLSEDETGDADDKIKRFKDEAFPKILVSVNMLDTGFDCPEVTHLVMARFTKSTILYQQMRGRGTRRADHIRKDKFTIWDFVGVTDFHMDDEGEHEGGLVIARPRKEPPKPRALLVLDIHDWIDPATRGWVAMDPDGNPVPIDGPEARAKELGERFEYWMAEHEGDLSPSQERLLKQIGEQIKVNATQISGFGMERLVHPPFSLRGGLAAAVEAFGGEEKLAGTLEHLNKAVFQSGGDGAH